MKLEKFDGERLSPGGIFCYEDALLAKLKARFSIDCWSAL